jgi:hypothetical protein
MMVGPVGSFSSPLQRNIYFAVVILIVIFAGPMAGRTERDANGTGDDCDCAGAGRDSGVLEVVAAAIC